MRFTITRKIATGVALVLILGLASMLVIYQGLSSVRASMVRLMAAKEPASAAAYEMEIQLHRMTAVVLRYLDTADVGARDEVRTRDVKFTMFRDQYLQLIETAEGRESVKAMDRHYDQFKTMGHALMARKAEQEALVARTAENFEKIDKIIDQELEPRLRQQTLLDLFLARKKFEALVAMEAEVAEIGLWLANYQRVRKVEYRDRLFQRERDARANLTQLKALTESREARYWVAVTEKLLDETMGLIRKALAVDEEIRDGLKRFSDLEEEIDRILDDQIQVAAKQDLVAPTKAADEATSAVMSRIQVLVPLFVLSALAVTLGLVWVVRRPVKALTSGTLAIARGDLTYRIRPVGHDELTDLAHEFNRMVAELETTTVSKAALEGSERKLKDTVTQLRQEIAERIHAEQEQARLQASLRRAETMAAMGSLVAGVAHEVRNPLFGISSVLDAMDARFGAVKEYERYLSVLRGEVKRLTALIQELFEYGKPSSLELSPGVIGDVIADAISARRALAEQLGVQIVNHVRGGAGRVMMDRTRLLRVFENLLENAIQHTPRGGSVTVEAAEVAENDTTRIECVVKDSGPGIPAEDLPRIFEPFFTRRRGGTGLGLSIVQRIVEDHSGQITAGNEPKGGAIMTVRLPRARSQANRA